MNAKLFNAESERPIKSETDINMLTLEKLSASYLKIQQKRDDILQSVLNTLPEHIAIVDKSGEIVATNESWNKFAIENCVNSPDGLGIGSNYLEVCSNSLKSDKSIQDFYSNLRQILKGTMDNFSYEYPCHSEDHKRWFVAFVTQLKINKQLFGAIVSHMDITKRKLGELELHRLASTDSLTGIMNRKKGIEFIHKKIKLSSRNGRIFTICFIDIDSLKFVNDTFGHKEGDCLIVSIVEIMQKVLRETDEMCRLGGDEFLLILEDSNENNTKSIINRIQKAIKRHNTKSEKPYKIQISYGIAEYNPKTTISVDDLICLADQNMYKMKALKGFYLN